MKLLIISSRGYLVNSKNEKQEDKGQFFSEAFQALNFETKIFYHRDLIRDDTVSRVKQAANLVFNRMGLPLHLDAWQRADAALIETVKSWQPEALLVFKGETLRPDLLQTVKSDLGVKCIVNFFPDNPFLYDEFMKGVDFYDSVFLKDSLFLEQFQAMGCQHAHYLAPSFHLENYSSADLESTDAKPYQCDVSIVGNLYPQREYVLKQLSEFNCKLWGRRDNVMKRPKEDPIRAMHQGYPVTGIERFRAFTTAPCSLNTHHPLNDPRGTNERDYDIAGSGGLLLTSAQADLDQHLQPGTHCITYDSIPALQERLRDILGNSDSYASIREAARIHCENNHTYHHRATTISDIALQCS